MCVEDDLNKNASSFAMFIFFLKHCCCEICNLLSSYVLFNVQENLEKEQSVEAAIEADQIYMTPTPVAEADATWLDIKSQEVYIYLFTINNLKLVLRL